MARVIEGRWWSEGRIIMRVAVKWGSDEGRVRVRVAVGRGLGGVRARARYDLWCTCSVDVSTGCPMYRLRVACE